MRALEQVRPIEKVTNKYQFIKTDTVVAGFESQGYYVHEYQEARVNKESRRGFQPHIVRLRHHDWSIPGRPELTPEIVIFSSHDGTRAFRIFIGVFRGVCANGNIFGESFFLARIVHRGNALEQLQTAIKQVTEARPRVTALIERLATTQVSHLEKVAYATRVATWRLRGVEKLRGVNVASVLAPQRAEDKANDAWTLFNIVQEKLMRGGIEYYTAGKEAYETKSKTTRGTGSVANQIGFNSYAFDEILKVAA